MYLWLYTIKGLNRYKYWNLLMYSKESINTSTGNLYQNKSNAKIAPEAIAAA